MKKEYANIPTSCFRIPKTTWKKVKMKAHEKDTSANKIVVEILENYFKEK